MNLKLFFTLLLDKLKLTPYHRRRKKYNIGEYSYICKTTIVSNAKIGKFCSVANHAVIGLWGHPMTTLTTSPFIYSRSKVQLMGDILVDEKDLYVPPPRPESETVTVLGNDVWVGYRAIVMPGVKIGDGAVVAAGAIVTHDVPPYAIVAGVPAKVVKYRFDEDTIRKLEELKWWDYPKNFIVKLPFGDINKCITMLEENKHLKGQG